MGKAGLRTYHTLTPPSGGKHLLCSLHRATLRGGWDTAVTQASVLELGWVTGSSPDLSVHAEKIKGSWKSLPPFHQPKALTMGSFLPLTHVPTHLMQVPTPGLSLPPFPLCGCPTSREDVILLLGTSQGFLTLECRFSLGFISHLTVEIIF